MEEESMEGGEKRGGKRGGWRRQRYAGGSARHLPVFRTVHQDRQSESLTDSLLEPSHRRRLLASVAAHAAE